MSRQVHYLAPWAHNWWRWPLAKLYILASAFWPAYRTLVRGAPWEDTQ